MGKQNSFGEGKPPKSREIYFYVIMGHFYYWINNALRRISRKAENTSIDDIQSQENYINQNDKIPLKLDVINSIPGGDITRNIELIKHIPENRATRRIIDATKDGAPLITLGDGSVPRVMITAGVHGNELPPQIAALKLIDDLQNAKLNGTIYIIPFIAPDASAENKKLSDGENLNLVANIPGSPTNTVFNTTQNLGITSLADCHGTSTDPAKDSVIYYPSIQSSKIAVYINKKSNSTLLALLQNPGMLISLCNSKGIPSVICEVESPDGMASSESIEVSYNQMKAFLDYHQIL